MRLRTFCCSLVWLVVSACAGNQPPAAGAQNEGAAPVPEGDGAAAEGGDHQGGPIGAQLVRDVTESEETYEVGPDEKNGLGGFNLSHQGKALWPPQGQGCDKTVGCCTALAALAQPLALSCLFALARDKACDKALATALAIAQEQSVALPESCN